MAPPAVNSRVDVLDDEGEMTDADRVGRRTAVAVLHRRSVEPHQLDPRLAVRGLQHRELGPDALQPHDPVDPVAANGPLTLPLEPQLEKELGRRLEVLDHDSDVVHALDRHTSMLTGRGAYGRPTDGNPQSWKDEY